MRVLILLALVAFTSAFDFPEVWEEWKKVSERAWRPSSARTGRLHHHPQSFVEKQGGQPLELLD